MLLFLLSNGTVKNKGSAKSVCNFGGRSLTVCPRGHAGIWLGQTNTKATARGQQNVFGKIFFVLSLIYKKGNINLLFRDNCGSDTGKSYAVKIISES